MMCPNCGEHLEWVSDGDKRLICKKCGKYSVLINGIPVEIED